MKAKHLLMTGIMIGSIVFGGTSGKISGRVIDKKTGDPLIGSNVFIVGTSLGAATDLAGYYTILNIIPGTYDVKCMMIGYGAITYTGVEVKPDLTTSLNFELETQVIAGMEVTIVAERPIIIKDLTSTKVSIGADEISRMPVENIDDVLQVQAGIIKGADGKLHIRGGRASEIVYLIDGISVNDPFSSEISVEVENDAVQELQVISGTFNAEYGQVMSGVVDIVTKEGGSELTGYISGYIGDYVSGNKKVFPNIDKFTPNGVSNIQVSLGGPVPGLGEKLSFFSSGRYYKDEGWLYGKKYVEPGFLDRSNPDSVFWSMRSGDSSFVPMNSVYKLSAQIKLTLRVSHNMKISYGAYWNKNDYLVYDHIFRFNPDGDYEHRKKGLTQIFSFNHTLTSKTFYTLKFSRSSNNYQRFVFDSPLDSQYVDVEAYRGRFYNGGTKLWHINRSTKSLGGKFDLTSQITFNHQIKTGFEVRRHQLSFNEYKVLIDHSTNYQPTVSEDAPGNINYNSYVRNPLEMAFYIQDKMEYDDIIVNAGMRVDYFDPAGEVPTDPRDPDNAKYYYILNADSLTVRIPERDYDPLTMNIIDTVDIRDNPWDYKYRTARSIVTLSPRIGIAYPISDRGIIHFSYGHFTQIPPFRYLYYNAEFEVRSGPLNKNEGKGVYDRVYSANLGAEGNKMGNVELKPQQTVIYELGLQQQLSENMGVDVTVYYKDMRHLLGTEIVEMYDTRRYARYVNRDIGSTKGVTIALTKRQSNNVSFAMDYTYQKVNGTASDPNDAFLDATSGREGEIKFVPLDWDQTHTLNTNISITYPGNWGVSILGRLGSGLPYTYEPPQVGTQYTRFENNERKPMNMSFDLNLNKKIQVAGITGSVYMKIYNLFDRKNEIAVYNDSGRAGYTIRTQYWGEWKDIGTVKDWMNRPHMYSQPRRIVVGFNIGL